MIQIVYLALVLAAPASAWTVDEVAAEVCKLHPESTLCPVVEPEPEPEPAVLFADLQDGQVIKLNDVACSGPESYSTCSKWTAYSGFVCDETACYGKGGGHAATMTDTVFKMDFDSFQWTELYPPTPCSVQQDESAINVEHVSYIYNYHERPISSHTYDMLALHGGYLYTLGGRGAGGLYKACSPTWLGTYLTGSVSTIARMRLADNTWEFMNGSVGTMPATWKGGTPGSVVVGDTAYIIGSSYMATYDFLTDTKAKVPTYANTGYENSVVWDGENIWSIGKIWNAGVSITRASLNSGLTLIDSASCLPTHTGYQWDSRNGVIGTVLNGTYQYYDPETNTCGSVPIESAYSADTEWWASQIVDGVMIFINNNRETLAYRIPAI